MAKIIFGPTGIGPAKEAVENLKEYHRLGFGASEIAFTYGVYLKEKDALEVGKVAKELGIRLSIHAPYFVNLNSKEKEKIEASKKRILKCCEIGHLMGARRIVFHPGFYSGMKSDEATEKIKDQVVELMEEIKKNRWDVELCMEVMGKINVFGSIDEVSEIVRETGCSVCIDFAHVLARYGDYSFEKVAEAFPQDKWQCHFSGMVYGEKGEKKHKSTEKEEWEKLISFLRGLDKEIVIINESPTPVEDSLLGMKVWERLKN